MFQAACQKTKTHVTIANHELRYVYMSGTRHTSSLTPRPKIHLGKVQSRLEVCSPLAPDVQHLETWCRCKTLCTYSSNRGKFIQVK